MSKRFDIFLAGEDDYEAEIGAYEVRVHRGAGPDHDGPYMKSTELPKRREARASSGHIVTPSVLRPAFAARHLRDFVGRVLKRTSGR